MVKKVIRKALEKTSRSLKVARGKAPRVELFHWSPDGESENFGDYISKIIVEKILNKEGHSLEDKIPKYRIWESPNRLIGVGSVIHFAKNNDVIWGSGVNGKKIDTKHYQFDKLDVRLVRGPLTRKFLCNEIGIEVPKLYGDPALIIGSIIGDEIKHSEREVSEYIFIPNLNDIEYFDVENTVSPLNDWEYVCASILEADTKC